jgi:hypothetical protein
MPDHIVVTVMQRLARLERELRWWKIVGSCALAGLGLVIILGAATRQDINIAEEIWARKFVITNQTGKPLGILNADAQGPNLQFLDDNGSTRLLLTVTEKDGPVLHLLNANRTLTAALGQETFFMGDNSAQTRFSVQIGGDGRPIVMLADRNGQTRLTFGITRDQGPAIRLVDGAGKTIWSAP